MPLGPRESGDPARSTMRWIASLTLAMTSRSRGRVASRTLFRYPEVRPLLAPGGAEGRRSIRFCCILRRKRPLGESAFPSAPPPPYLQPGDGLYATHPKLPGLLDLPQWQGRRMRYPMTMFRLRRVLEHDRPEVGSHPGTKTGGNAFDIRLFGSKAFRDRGLSFKYDLSPKTGDRPQGQTSGKHRRRLPGASFERQALSGSCFGLMLLGVWNRPRERT